jgi:hypothetical protein
LNSAEAFGIPVLVRPHNYGKDTGKKDNRDRNRNRNTLKQEARKK